MKELDGEYRETNIHVEILPGGGNAEAGFRGRRRFRREPAVEAACALMNGSYEGFSEVYAAALMQWIEDNQRGKSSAYGAKASIDGILE